jgi:prepilin-type N-terminal cleavage/methylation domain-containing protein
MKKSEHHMKKTKRSGFTLVELLVAIALFSVVVAIATSGFVNALRTQRQVASLISTQSNVTLVLEQMAREVRTGYLFCHDYGVNNNNAGLPSINCARPVKSLDPANQCTVTDSGQPAGDAPAEDVYSGNSNKDLAEWSCPSIDYHNAQGAEVNYSLQDGALMKSDTSAADQSAQSITGNGVSIQYLNFILFGNLEGDHWTPRITILIGAAPSSTDPAVSGDVINLETTVSAREIDCSTDSSVGC